MSVITCVSLLQGAGGRDYMISMAEKILRKKPSAITFLGPLVSYIFTVICGTSYVAFSVYPVIAEIAISAKVRPERGPCLCRNRFQHGCLRQSDERHSRCHDCHHSANRRYTAVASGSNGTGMFPRRFNRLVCSSINAARNLPTTRNSTPRSYRSI